MSRCLALTIKVLHQDQKTDPGGVGRGRAFLASRRKGFQVLVEILLSPPIVLVSPAEQVAQFFVVVCFRWKIVLWLVLIRRSQGTNSNARSILFRVPEP